MERAGYKVTRVTETGGLRCVTVRGIATTLDPMDTNEWQIILGALCAGQKAQPQEHQGFIYTFPLLLG